MAGQEADMVIHPRNRRVAFKHDVFDRVQARRQRIFNSLAK